MSQIWTASCHRTASSSLCGQGRYINIRLKLYSLKKIVPHCFATVANNQQKDMFTYKLFCTAAPVCCQSSAVLYKQICQ